MGKVPNYDQKGKLKNKVIIPKYSGEREITEILEDANYKKIGACEISCVGCFDTETKKENPERMAEINALIKGAEKKLEKPKSQIDLLKEQIDLLKEQNKALKGKDVKTDNIPPNESAPKIEAAQEEYKKLYGKKPNHLMKLETLLEKIKEKK